jgi:NAD-dependent DNA ligase
MLTPEWLTKEEMLWWFRKEPDDGKYCPDCYNKLKLNEERIRYYCPNINCSNNDVYDLDGSIIEE